MKLVQIEFENDLKMSRACQFGFPYFERSLRRAFSALQLEVMLNIRAFYFIRSKTEKITSFRFEMFENVNTLKHVNIVF